ncbi:MAG: energy-coupling factor transporter transmembrane protein EcfT [Clostridia bacterium]|nr:energy-coupling factor transporter transmembrane protein EcfT [Clostridia bacterium]
MLRDITLGQFFPGNSILHRADPRTKLILTVVYIVCVFLCKSVWSFVLLFAATAALVILSTIPARLIMRSVRPIIFIVIFTGLINLFMTRGEGDPLIRFKFIKIYAEGVKYALLMILRITSLVVGTSVILTYTTSPIALTDGLEQLLAPLKKIRFPVHEFSMMMTIALRFIPTLIEETDKIMSAQKARGADFSSGGLIKRAKALIPVLIPLFISAFRRAAELATAMECRCYHGGEGRTRMNILRYSALDFILMTAFAVFLAGIIVLNLI